MPLLESLSATDALNAKFSSATINQRLDDVEDKWGVAPENASFTTEEIMAQTAFQEQFFKTEILV